jgi:hypothetical protein
MKRPIVGPAVFALSVVAVVLACRVGEVAVADPAPAKEPSVSAANKLVAWGPSGLRCTDAEWVLPENNDNHKQTVRIEVDLKKSPPIQTPDPKCAKESYKGSLTFKVGALPKDHRIEIDFMTRKDQAGKPHKSPFLRNGTRDMYPQAGRCLLKSNQECVFGKHDKLVETNEVFSYTIYLWGAGDELVDFQDPGIMVIDNP